MQNSPKANEYRDMLENRRRLIFQSDAKSIVTENKSFCIVEIARLDKPIVYGGTLRSEPTNGFFIPKPRIKDRHHNIRWKYVENVYVKPGTKYFAPVLVSDTVNDIISGSLEECLAYIKQQPHVLDDDNNPIYKISLCDLYFNPHNYVRLDVNARWNTDITHNLRFDADRAIRDIAWNIPHAIKLNSNEFYDACEDIIEEQRNNGVYGGVYRYTETTLPHTYLNIKKETEINESFEKVIAVAKKIETDGFRLDEKTIWASLLADLRECVNITSDNINNIKNEVLKD